MSICEFSGIRICRKGFPNRTLHPDYVQRYAILCADESKSSSDPKECAIKMLERLVREGSLKEEMYRIGVTKVSFLPNYDWAILTRRCNAR